MPDYRDFHIHLPTFLWKLRCFIEGIIRKRPSDSFIHNIAMVRFRLLFVQLSYPEISFKLRETITCDLLQPKFKVKDYSLKIQKSAYHYFQCSFQNEVVLLCKEKTFGKILSRNYGFLIPVVRVMSHNCAYLLHRASHFMQHKYSLSNIKISYN